MSTDRGTGVRVGIALSGGTLKAAAHAGVLAVLDEIGVTPHAVAGTSAGAWVAALYAHGYRGQELARLVSEFPGFRLLDWGHPWWSSLRCMWYYRRRSQVDLAGPLPSGVLRGRRMLRYFRRTLGHRSASVPYYIVATDALSGKPVVFTNHTDVLPATAAITHFDPALAVLASCAIPGLLPPVPWQHWLLVDGGFRHYVPVDVLRAAGCTKIIVVNLYRLSHNWLPRSVFHLVFRSLDILLQESVDNDVAGTDVYVIRPEVGDITWLSVGQLRRCFDSGVASAMREAQRIQAWLAQPAAPRTAARLVRPIVAPLRPAPLWVGEADARRRS